MIPEKPPLNELAHHGVKGQKWGVVKEDLPTGETSKTDSAKSAEYSRLAGSIAKKAGVDSELAQMKYGPKTPEQLTKAQQQERRDKLKKIGVNVGIGLAAGALFYAASQTDTAKASRLLTTNTKAYAHAVDGLDLNWEHGVHLEKGSVLKRLSSVAEKDIRPGGFFAAHRAEDVESYKAILPSFWESWGVGKAQHGGFINHYQAQAIIKAPSGKQSMGLFKRMLGEDETFAKLFQQHYGYRANVNDPNLKATFTEFSQHWVDESNPLTKHFFQTVKSNGYNALIDFNDAGKLGKTPLRVLDGSPFKIIKNEPQTLDDFYKAAKKWTPELVHMLKLSDEENELAHHGVKGMHWGQRKDGPAGVSVKVNRAAKKDAEEFTRAKLFYGKGAGTRRKLIKAQVETKKKADPSYAKAFDHHVANTNLAKRADQAKAQRRRKDTTDSARKTARGVGHILRGNSQYANTAAAVAVAAGVHAHNTGADKVIADTLKKKMSDIRGA